MTTSPAPVGGPSWAAVPPDAALTAGGLAARLGAYCWVEQQLFGLLGSWVVQVSEPDVKALLLEQSEHAAWRAARWYELLPPAPPGRDALVVAPEGVPALADLAAAVLDRDAAESDRDVGDPDGTLTRLALAERVLLPRLLAAYTAHLGWAREVAEAPVRRVLAMAVDDLGADVRHGERLVQGCQTEASDVEVTTAVVARAEAAVVAAGGLLGPGSIGLRPR